MRTLSARTLPAVAVVIAALASSLAAPRPAAGGVLVYESEDVTMELGLKLQPRLSLELGAPASGTEPEWQRNFLVRRARMKIGGRAMSATYALEWRLDGTGAAAGTVLGASPVAGVENAYVQFPVSGSACQIRAGLYDQPFSRDRLTSDSKQLTVDRGDVSGVPNGVGLADNAIGVDARGSLSGGATTYVIGVYDNRTIPAALQSTMPMVIGRLDFNFGSSKDVYQDAHFGDDTWASLGVNGGFQGGLQDLVGGDDGQNTALGVDGMVDVPVAMGRLLVVGEVNSIQTEAPSADGVTTLVMMAGAGFLFRNNVQPVVRHDQIHMDDAVGGGKSNTTTVGCNCYLRGHNLKIQADVSFKSGTGESVDGGRLQAQVDF